MIRLVCPEPTPEMMQRLRRAWALHQLAHLVAEDSRKIVTRSEELVARARRGVLRGTGG